MDNCPIGCPCDFYDCEVSSSTTSTELRTTTTASTTSTSIRETTTSTTTVSTTKRTTTSTTTSTIKDEDKDSPGNELHQVLVLQTVHYNTFNISNEVRLMTLAGEETDISLKFTFGSRVEIYKVRIL